MDCPASFDWGDSGLEKRWPQSSVYMPVDVVNILTRFQKFWVRP